MPCLYFFALLPRHYWITLCLAGLTPEPVGVVLNLIVLPNQFLLLFYFVIVLKRVKLAGLGEYVVDVGLLGFFFFSSKACFFRISSGFVEILEMLP